MAEVAYGNYQVQGFGNQGMMTPVQQYNRAGQNGVMYGHINPRYNPYQRPSPPMQQCRARQSPPTMLYKPNQMVNRHHQHQNWGNGEDHNGNSRMAPMQANTQQWQGNWMGPNQGMKSVSPPLPQPNYGPSSPVIPGMGIQEPVMRRRMSSSSQGSEYGQVSRIPTPITDNRWVMSPNSGGNMNFNQFPQNGGFGGAHVSPNPGVVPSWNTNNPLPYNTPSPLSSVSSENSPPHHIPPCNQPQPFRQPTRIPQQMVQAQHPKVPLVSSDVPPGTTTGTSGNDWEVTCLGTSVKLRNSELWKNFENVVMEMVISKHGRRMFPVLEYDVKGLHPYKLYSVFVDFVLANKYVWKFSEQKWNPSGLAPEEDIYDQSHRVCLHPESPAPGEVWNKRGFSFSKMKLSNHLHNDSDKLSLKSLHKYQPRLHVVEVDPRDPTVQTNLRTFIIPKTQFMTVTLYHNTDVAQLKINLNPFARCFRDKEMGTSTKPTEDEHSPNDVKKDGNTSQNDDVASPWNIAPDSVGVCSPASQEIQPVYQVPNPVPESDLQRAKNFMQAQLDTMTQLVRTQDALSSTNQQTKEGATSTESNQALASVDFDRELEGLLSNIGENAATKTEQNPEKKTVHHFPPNSEGPSEPKKRKIQHNKPPAKNPLDKYELLNVDRCFPPNAIAPLSNTLPFDPSTIKKEKSLNDQSNQTLPTFFKCSYYQEQAAQAAISSNKQNDTNTTQLPVIYVPKPTTKNETITSLNDTSSNVASPAAESGTSNLPSYGHNPQVDMAQTASPAPSASSSDSMTSFNPFTLPTLSPKSLQQFLDVDINDMMAGNKRKCSFDDEIDDDVFTGDTSLITLNACDIFPPQTQTIISTISQS